MTPSLQNAPRVVMRFAYTDMRLIPRPFFVRRDFVADNPLIVETERALVLNLYPEISREDFVLMQVRTDKVHYTRAGIQQYETRFSFERKKVPSLVDAVPMREAFFKMTQSYTWQTSIHFDSKYKCYSIYCVRPRPVNPERATSTAHTGDALLHGKR